MKMLPRSRILIVDDEPLVLDMFNSFFSRLKFDVTTACTAIEAIAHAKADDYDVVFCDVVLQEQNGIDLLAQLSRYNTAAKLILITASPNDADLVRAQELNAAYLSKPVSFEDVIKTINSSSSSRVICH